MQESSRGFSNEVRIFLENHGIDPIYAVTLFTLALVWSYRKDIEKWDELEGWRKGIIGSTIYGAIIFSIISLLKLLGVIEL